MKFVCVALAVAALVRSQICRRNAKKHGTKTEKYWQLRENAIDWNFIAALCFIAALMFALPPA